MRSCRSLQLAVFAIALVAQSTGSLASDPELIAAARKQNLPAARALISRGADVNVTQGDGATALHWAAHWDNRDLALLLLAAGADADVADDLGVTPLALAAQNGSSFLVEKLLKALADPNVARVTGETPLMAACRTGNVDVVKQLLRAGADVNAKENARGQTPLMLACAERHVEVARLLLAAGAEVSARSKNRFTPLLFAAQQGSIPLAELLLAAGASVNESAPDGIAGDTNARSFYRANTDAAALLVAIDSGRLEMALFLIERGADVNHKGAGRTALHSAVQQAQLDVVKALLAKGADANARLEKPLPQLSRAIKQDSGLDINPLGATPFWLAASFCNVPVMKALAAGGADVKLTSNDGTTPLMVAAGVDFVDGQDKYGRRTKEEGTIGYQRAAIEAVQMCLDLGLDINTANDKSQTAIHGAVYLGGTMLVQYMADKGAKINVVNKRGQTPWLIAKGEYHSGSYFVHEDTAALLEKLGADTTLGKDLGANFARGGTRRISGTVVDVDEEEEE